ncbi:hypothetical protein Tco_0907826 [Tanacetum coccineum]|uniref:Uncharacterized protein n=1 Tax=Tanacetum coccineum TaxID=301880 RepID=A0ABQ5CKE0_9ASTR
MWNLKKDSKVLIHLHGYSPYHLVSLSFIVKSLQFEHSAFPGAALEDPEKELARKRIEGVVGPKKGT